MLNISDEETIQIVTENLYIQYFLGYESFTSKAPFDFSLFVEIRKREFLESADQAFGGPSAAPGTEQLEQEREQLYRKIGELERHREFLKKHT
jgi:hypothetical protein